MRFCWAQYAFWAMIAVLGMTSLLAGCGAKGDLYLPREQQQASPVEPAPQETPVSDNAAE